MKKHIGFSTLLLLVVSISTFAQIPGKYTGSFDENSLKSTIKFLSDDGFEGRGPGSRGGELAAKYIAHRLQMAGIKPGNDGSYFQPVSLVAVKVDPKTRLRVSNRNASFDYQFGTDFVVSTSAQKRNVNIDAELVLLAME